MLGAGHQPQVVEGEPLPHRRQGLLHQPPVVLQLRVPHRHRVHVNHQMDPLLGQDVPLDGVDDVVAHQNVLLRRNLGVDRGKAPPRPVAVNHQVVAVQYPWVGADKGLNLRHQLLGRGLPQQLVHSLADNLHPGTEDKQRHQHPHIPIGGEGQHRSQQGGKKHPAGGQHIGKAIRRRRFH